MFSNAAAVNTSSRKKITEVDARDSKQPNTLLKVLKKHISSGFADDMEFDKSTCTMQYEDTLVTRMIKLTYLSETKGKL